LPNPEQLCHTFGTRRAWFPSFGKVKAATALAWPIQFDTSRELTTSLSLISSPQTQSSAIGIHHPCSSSPSTGAQKICSVLLCSGDYLLSLAWRHSRRWHVLHTRSGTAPWGVSPYWARRRFAFWKQRFGLDPLGARQNNTIQPNIIFQLWAFPPLSGDLWRNRGGVRPIFGAP